MINVIMLISFIVLYNKDYASCSDSVHYIKVESVIFRIGNYLSVCRFFTTVADSDHAQVDASVTYNKAK